MKIEELLDEIAGLTEDAEKLNVILPDAQLHSAYTNQDLVSEFRQFLEQNKKDPHMKND